MRLKVKKLGRLWQKNSKEETIWLTRVVAKIMKNHLIIWKLDYFLDLDLSRTALLLCILNVDLLAFTMMVSFLKVRNFILRTLNPNTGDNNL